MDEISPSVENDAVSSRKSRGIPLLIETSTSYGRDLVFRQGRKDSIHELLGFFFSSIYNILSIVFLLRNTYSTLLIYKKRISRLLVQFQICVA